MSLLTTVSFFAAWAKDEGQIDEKSGMVKNLIADSFEVFVFPTFHLFWDTIVANSSKLFIPAIAVNVLLWTIFIERLIAFATKLLDHKRLNRNVR